VTEAIVERLRDTGDLDGVLEIESLSFNNPTTREWYERELQRPDVCCIYILRTPEYPVAGFCAFWRIASEMHINNLAVRPELRGSGLGSVLLQASLDAAAGMGASSATLEVRRSNVAARRLYARAGFREAGVRRNYYTQPVEDALVLTRDSIH
jgi:[ribosomal protein S18]-alanine N-acetyltransferase